LYVPVPKRFVADDFFLFMAVLEQGFRTVMAPAAECRMAVNGMADVQWRRKLRFSTGNYQNLGRFFPMLFGFRMAGFAFFSHKVLRWLTPFLLVLAFACGWALCAGGGWFWQWAFGVQCVAYGIAMIYTIGLGFGADWKPLKPLGYFLLMNAALLVGLFRYLAGKAEVTWETAPVVPGKETAAGSD
jgi:hypothetical protein